MSAILSETQCITQLLASSSLALMEQSALKMAAAVSSCPVLGTVTDAAR